MRLAYWFFLVAVAAALFGMSLGIWMGIARDHTLSPVHAHVNLLGWASMFLYGLYYRTEPAAVSRLAGLHFAVATSGLVLMTGGLGPMLYGDERFFPAAVGGALLSLAAMGIFFVVVARGAVRAHRARGSAGLIAVS